MLDNFFRESITINHFVQPKTVSRFIGSKGSSLASFEKACHVRTVVITNGANISLRTTGNKENVENAIFRFFKTVAELEDSFQVYEMDVPLNQIGYLIGSHGWSLNEIIRLSGAKVVSKNLDATTARLTIEGNHKSILLAVEFVLKRLAKYEYINRSKEESYVTFFSGKVASGEENF